jgi:hypothetical protein
MKFHSMPDDDKKLLANLIYSEKGLVEIGVHRVMFGWRVRAGFANQSTCELDWCAGGNWDDVCRLYSICKSILESREENLRCFYGLPTVSAIKPFYKDEAFVKLIESLSPDFELIKLEKPNF